jgi:hypothetical protein
MKKKLSAGARRNRNWMLSIVAMIIVAVVLFTLLVINGYVMTAAFVLIFALGLFTGMYVGTHIPRDDGDSVELPVPKTQGSARLPTRMGTQG